MDIPFHIQLSVVLYRWILDICICICRPNKNPLKTLNISICIQLLIVQMDIGHSISHSVVSCIVQMNIGHFIVHLLINYIDRHWAFHCIFSYQLYSWTMDASFYIQVSIVQMNIEQFFVHPINNWQMDIEHIIVNSVVNCINGLWTFHCIFSCQLNRLTWGILFYIQLSIVQIDIGHFIVYSVSYQLYRWTSDMSLPFSYQLYIYTLDSSLYSQLSIVQMDIGRSIVHSVINCTDGHWIFHCTFSYQM